MKKHGQRLINWIVFTKLASQLTADKLVELAVIPVIFIVQTLVSYLVSVGVGKAFGFSKRPANFVTAMGVCSSIFLIDGNANILDRSSEIQTLCPFPSSSHCRKH